MIFGYRKRNAGFTLVEVMCSLLLVSLAMLFLMKVTVQVCHLNRQSYRRFYVNVLLDAKKNQLLSKSFESTLLKPGEYTESLQGCLLDWKIRDLDPSLKKVVLTIRKQEYYRKTFFYKSKYIKEVNGE